MAKINMATTVKAAFQVFADNAQDAAGVMKTPFFGLLFVAIGGSFISLSLVQFGPPAWVTVTYVIAIVVAQALFYLAAVLNYQRFLFSRVLGGAESVDVASAVPWAAVFRRTVIYSAVLGLPVLALTVAQLVLGLSHTPWLSSEAFAFGALALYLLYSFVAVRFALVLPAVAAGDVAASFKRAFKLGRDNTWRLVGLMVATGILVFVIAFLVLFVASFFAGIIALAVMAAVGPASTMVLAILYAPLNVVFQLVIACIFGGLAVFAYAQLKPEWQEGWRRYSETLASDDEDEADEASEQAPPAPPTAEELMVAPKNDDPENERPKKDPNDGPRYGARKRR